MKRQPNEVAIGGARSFVVDPGPGVLMTTTESEPIQLRGSPAVSGGCRRASLSASQRHTLVKLCRECRRRVRGARHHYDGSAAAPSTLCVITVAGTARVNELVDGSSSPCEQGQDQSSLSSSKAKGKGRDASLVLIAKSRNAVLLQDFKWQPNLYDGRGRHTGFTPYGRSVMTRNKHSKLFGDSKKASRRQSRMYPRPFLTRGQRE